MCEPTQDLESELHAIAASTARTADQQAAIRQMAARNDRLQAEATTTSTKSQELLHSLYVVR